jgi:FMN-dependent NADH-azoreductase
MPKLLHISASPRGGRSASITVAKHFIDAYTAAHPGDTVETLDLWHTQLPEFDGATIEGKYAIMSGQQFTPEVARAWETVTAIANHFKSADKYLFSLPMWNFSIPYKLKHYIDVLAQPGLTFGFSPESGYKGLVTGKPAVLIFARGGAYGPGSGAEAYDAQSKYLKQVLGFIGFTDVKEIFVEPTAMGPKEEAIAKVKPQVEAFAHAL